MKKTKKSQVRNYSVSYPETIDIDTLSYTADDDLMRRQDYLFSERERYLHEDVDVRPWETEICYVQRELRIRYVRRHTHDRYLSSQFSEFHVPAGKSYVN